MALPKRDDLFLIVSRDGTSGALGLVVNKVNPWLISLREGAGGGTTTSILPTSDDLFLIESKLGMIGAYGLLVNNNMLSTSSEIGGGGGTIIP